MRSGRNLLIVLAAITCCVVVIWLSGSIEGSQKTYEIRPTIRLPGYDPWDASGRTDAARALGAYERLMDHYIDLTEENLFSIDAEIRNVADKLEIIDARLARIESALGVKHPLMRSTAAEPNGPHTAAPHGNTAAPMSPNNQ